MKCSNVYQLFISMKATSHNYLHKSKHHSEPKYITANKDVNIIYDKDKKEFYLKVPKTCLLKCDVPKEDFMRAVERCFIENSIKDILNQFTTTKPEARLRLSITPLGEWSVAFSHSPIELIEFTQVITSENITPSEAGELLYQKFIKCNGKLAIDLTVWYY